MNPRRERPASARESVPRDPEVVDPVVETVAWLMDRAIPMGPWAIGLDAILGLIPGVGDLIGTLASGIIIQRAIKAGLPRSAIARMVLNVAIDGLLGAIPLIGDIFDVVWQANVKNLVIFRESMSGRRDARRDWLFTVLMVLAFAAAIALPILMAIWVVQAGLRLLG